MIEKEQRAMQLVSTSPYNSRPAITGGSSMASLYSRDNSGSQIERNLSLNEKLAMLD